MKYLLTSLCFSLLFLASTFPAEADEARCRSHEDTEKFSAGERVLYTNDNTKATFQVLEPVAPGAIRGIVCTADQKPLPNQDMTLVRYTGKIPAKLGRAVPKQEDYDTKHFKIMQRQPLNSDSEGRFERRGLPAGDYAIFVDWKDISSVKTVLLDFRVTDDVSPKAD